MANDPNFLPSMDYFKYEKDVIKDFYNQINDNLCNDINVIADATHISWKSLRKTILVYFNRGLDIALPQNAKRGGVERVPEDVIKRMWAGRYMPARAKAKGLVDEYMIV